MLVIWIEIDISLKFCRKLAGKTLYISGASRGIGKAIALKAAQDGAKVVIAAKTATAHPKLPGTIYTAAEESKHKFTYPTHFLLYKLSIFSFSVKLIYVSISCVYVPTKKLVMAYS